MHKDLGSMNGQLHSRRIVIVRRIDLSGQLSDWLIH